MKRKDKLKRISLRICLLTSDTTAFEDDSGVIIDRPVVEELILGEHLHPDDFCQLLAFAVEYLCLEPLVHAMFGPFSVCVEIEIPVIDARNLYSITVKLDGICRSAAVRVTLLVLENDEEYVR